MTSVLGLLAIPRTDPPPVRPKARDPSLAYIKSGAPPSRRSFCWQSRRNAALKLAFHDMDNKRGSPRQRVLKSGKIVFAGGSFSVDCTIRNLSETGAQLQIPTTVAIPDKFTLVDAHARTRREATVVWRKGDQISVRFDPPKA